MQVELSDCEIAMIAEALRQYASKHEINAAHDLALALEGVAVLDAIEAGEY